MFDVIEHDGHRRADRLDGRHESRNDLDAAAARRKQPRYGWAESETVSIAVATEVQSATGSSSVLSHDTHATRGPTRSAHCARTVVFP